jgi:predicted permease
MDKFLKIVGIIVVAWIALSLVGWIVGFVVKTVFVVAIIAGVALAVGFVANKALGGRRRSQIGSRR